MPKIRTKYLAIKVRGFDTLLWFERAKATEENGRFVGRDGWGENGAYTCIDCESQCIEARIDSEDLQYLT
jgi:hypothetical protein